MTNWDIGIVDTVADNASSGLFVLGGPVRRLDRLDLRALQMQGTEAGRGGLPRIGRRLPREPAQRDGVVRWRIGTT